MLIFCVFEILRIVERVRVHVDMHAERTGHKLFQIKLCHVIFLWSIGILTSGHLLSWSNTLKDG